jgi:hypothetical protein
MNTKNALGFLFLGMLLHVTPTLAQSLTTQADLVADTSSVRTVWLEFMSWVIGGIGSAYLIREAAVRLPALLAVLSPARLLRPIMAKGEAVQIPVGARVSVSS